MFLSDLSLTNEHFSTENLLGPPQSSASSPSFRATVASFGASLAVWDLCSWNSFLMSSKVGQRDQERKLCDILEGKGTVWFFVKPLLSPLTWDPGVSTRYSPQCHQVLIGCRECYYKGPQPFIWIFSTAEVEQTKGSPGLSVLVAPHCTPAPSQLHSFSSQSPACTSLSKSSPHPAQRSSFSGQTLTE